jgi:4-alpha-glucanotransferase
MSLPRSSGVLLHPTSLPGPHGVGDLGRHAFEFVDFLARSGQKWWQMLPLGPTGYGNSPYQSHSSFAGSAMLISPEDLVERGWLESSDLNDIPAFSADHAEFDRAHEWKEHLLGTAFLRFQSGGTDDRFETFLSTNRGWLDDYCLYMAIKYEHGGRPWTEWEPGLIRREPETMASWRDRLSTQIRYHEFVQFAFHLQWQALRAACRDRNIALIGDLPIFVAHDSADVWANPHLFTLDEHGQPTAMAGVPPDYFSQTGQLWGNPLYRWDVHRQDGYAWWTSRFRGLLALVDLVRIDHFRGLAAYWEVPAGSEPAATGRWVDGPRKEFFEVIGQNLGSLPLIAEDLGVITSDVDELRLMFDLPGMRVLQFGFDPSEGSDRHLPHRWEQNCVAYTGTHDNDTTVGWFTPLADATTQPVEEVQAARRYALRYAKSDGKEIHWDLIRIVMASVADVAVVPMQDLLGLGSSARMNFPGKPAGNWGWRYRAEMLTDDVRDRLAALTAIYVRWNGRMDWRKNPAFRVD